MSVECQLRTLRKSRQNRFSRGAETGRSRCGLGWINYSQQPVVEVPVALIRPHDVAYPILVEAADAERDNRLHANCNVTQLHDFGNAAPLMRFKRAEDAEFFFDAMRKGGVPA